MKNITETRHTLAHLLAAALLEINPKALPTIGPAIDDGFYYDFDLDKPITEKELGEIEENMVSLLKKWDKFTHKEVSEKEAKALYKNNPYKLELIDEIVNKGEKITLYTCGDFTDLCRGGHLEHPNKEIAPNSWKLSRIAGAYWRGDENNKMLTRIYGLAFASKAELEKHEAMRAEAEKRDHKKLGQELNIFTSSPLVGAGLPLLQPKGAAIRKEIEDYLWILHRDRGYERVWTPHIAKEELYKTSGHAEKFGDELFRVSGKEEKFILKPMNCPHHMQIFASNYFSYRDLPVRYFEPATVYRDEKKGQLAGLTRVRSITQDDGHLFCAVTDIEKEVGTIVNIIKEFYSTFGMMAEYWVSLSIRGADKSKYLGSDDVWETAQGALEKAAKENKLNYKIVEGEAAFYGPKLDFIFKDSIGREWQLATIQCDFNLPNRFDLSFINEKGEKERPVVIHRAISGSLERFMGIIIEHYAGKFPLWIAPVQVAVIPVTEGQYNKAEEIRNSLRKMNIRASLDTSKEGFGKKVRKAKTELIPYFIIIGEKDEKAGKVTLESRDKGKIGELTLNEVEKILISEIQERK